jgi:hypothetical protein
MEGSGLKGPLENLDPPLVPELATETVFRLFTPSVHPSASPPWKGGGKYYN